MTAVIENAIPVTTKLADRPVRTEAISCWRDAEELLGLEVLKTTMEGPDEFRRVYCRVTQAGRELLELYLGVNRIELYQESGTTRWGEVAEGCMLLDHSLLFPLVAFVAGNKRYPGYVFAEKYMTLVSEKPYMDMYKKMAADNTGRNPAKVYELIPGTPNYKRVG